MIVSLVTSIFCKPQSASCAHFRIPKPVISHLLIFNFSLEKHEKTLKVLTKTLTEAMPLRENVESSASAVNKKRIIMQVDIEVKRTYKAIARTYADIDHLGV